MLVTHIAVVDATRARMFLHERSADPDGLHDRLCEVTDFVNPARHQTAQELFSDRSGSRNAGASQYGLDDHRAAHVDQFDAEFASLVVGELHRVMKATSSDRLVVCASPHMLGVLRKHMAILHRDVGTIDELPRDFTQLAVSDVHDQLCAHKILPPRPTVL